MDSILKNIYELMINAIFFVTALAVRTIGKNYEWFDGSVNLLLTLIGITSGLLTVRWLLVRTKCTKLQSEAEMEAMKVEIELKRLQLKQAQNDTQ